jgi:hypothetical protein
MGLFLAKLTKGHPIAMDIIALAKEAGGLSVVGLLILALIGLYFKWWVPGWVYLAERDAKNYWRTGMLRLLNVSEQNLPKGNEGGD